MNIGTFLRRVAEREPGKTYLHYKDQRYTFAEFVDCVSGSAGAFSQLGIRKGDRVCILLPNCPEYLHCWLGLAQIGAITVFVNTALTEREIEYIVNHSEAVAIVTSSRFLDLLSPICSRAGSLKFPLISVDADPAPGAIGLSAAVNGANRKLDTGDVDPQDVATFIYTSGTTGPPKAVMQTHQTYVLTGEAFPIWLGLHPSDRLYTCLPLFHINAQAYSVMGSLGAGASLVLAEKFSASTLWDQIRLSQSTELNLIGAMPQVLLQQPPSESDRNHSARLVYTAPALDPDSHEAFEERFGVVLTVGYGMSECTFGTINPVAKSQRRLGSIGQPRSHPQHVNQLRIVDDQDRDAEPGQAGEIVMKNLTVMKGYYRDPEATTAVLRDGWLHTGDLARKDPDGFLNFVGRKKDMVRLKGENVSTFEVESVINTHPGVLESAVVGIPAKYGDEQVVAFVVMKPGRNSLSGAEIVEWCKPRLASFKIPVVVEFRKRLPKTVTEKTAKHVLVQEMIEQQSGRN